MIDNFILGSSSLFGDPVTIAIFIFGVLGGMLFGAIPGVSMLTLAAILLPFTANLNPSQGVMLFAVIYCTGTYGGAITAILFNIPGGSSIFDLIFTEKSNFNVLITSYLISYILFQ